jgi:hypothetical protein
VEVCWYLGKLVTQEQLALETTNACVRDRANAKGALIGDLWRCVCILESLSLRKNSVLAGVIKAQIQFLITLSSQPYSAS